MYKVLKFDKLALANQKNIDIAVIRIKNQLNDKLIIVVSSLDNATVLTDELKKNKIKIIFLTNSQVKLRIKQNRLVDVNCKIIKECLETYDVVILPGFQGINSLRFLETIDSDYSAIYLAKRLNLNEVYLYSDTCGIYTGDPKYLNGVRLIKHIGYRQALDLVKHQAQIISYQALLEGYKKDGFKIKLRSIYNDQIGTLINHDDTSVRTMAIDFNYWLIHFNDKIDKKEYRYLTDQDEENYFIKADNLKYLTTSYNKITKYSKIHFVGCYLENDEIYRNFLDTFVITSKNETDSYYIDDKNLKQDLNLLHDLIVRTD